MKQSIKTGFSFGLTSGVITTLGLMIGLFSSTHSEAVIIGGILTIAIADAMSDALGIHISEESKSESNHKHVWESTISTFLAKLIFASTFIIPLVIFSLKMAIIISVIWGLLLLVLFSFYIAKIKKEKPRAIMLEHLFIAVLVIILTYFVGVSVDKIFV